MVTELGGTAAFALGAGVATFFAPCSYALLPGYVGYYVAATEGDSPPIGGVLARGVAAAAGVVGAFLVLAVAAIAASDLIERVLLPVEVAVGILLIVLGIAVAAGRTGSLHVTLPERRSTVLGFALFGALYALAAMACVLPLFLAVSLQSLTLPPAGTAVVLGAYGGSVGVLMIGATVAVAFGHDALAGRIAARAGSLSRVAGAILVVAGVGQLYFALAA